MQQRIAFGILPLGPGKSPLQKLDVTLLRVAGYRTEQEGPTGATGWDPP